MTPGSQQPFLKTLAQALKGTVSQNINVDSYSANKGLHFACLKKELQFFFTPREAVFSDLKVK